jgi:small nuclear ribonucleoprotein (snRNP)-like protein
MAGLLAHELIVDEYRAHIVCYRNIIGTLKGFDQTINIVLSDSHERVYSSDSGVMQNVLGLYLIRGDNM